MGKRLYIGSLPFDTTEAQLQEHFTACGRVESVKIIMDRVTGRSKGFGFVEMSTDLEAQAAIQKLNGSTLGSRQIVVNEARPQEERRGPSGPGPRRDGFGGGRRDGFGGGRRDGFGGGGGFRQEGFNGNRRDGGRRNDRFGGGDDHRGNRPRRDDRWGGARNPFDDSFGNR